MAMDPIQAADGKENKLREIGLKHFLKVLMYSLKTVLKGT